MKFKYLILAVTAFSLSLHAQSRWAVGIEGGLSFPVGEFADTYKTGYSGSAQVTYLWGENALLSISAGLSQWEVDNEKINKLLSDAGINAKADLDANLRIIPVLVGVKWYFIKGKYRPYILIEGGFHNYRSSIKGNINVNGNVVPVEEINESGTETALSLGGGTFLELSKNWYLELTGKYNVLTNARAIKNPDDNQTISGVSRTIQYITVRLGINYRF